MATETEYILLKRELNKMGEELIKEIRLQLAADGKNASGTLSKSLTWRTIDVLGTLALRVFGANYLDYLIAGRRPGKQPPTSAIRKWIDLKPVARFRDKKGRFITKDSQAFLIARSIGKKGIKPYGGITIAQRRVLEKKKAALTGALGQDFMKTIQNILINR